MPPRWPAKGRTPLASLQAAAHPTAIPTRTATGSAGQGTASASLGTLVVAGARGSRVEATGDPWALVARAARAHLAQRSTTPRRHGRVTHGDLKGGTSQQARRVEGGQRRHIERDQERDLRTHEGDRIAASCGEPLDGVDVGLPRACREQAVHQLIEDDVVDPVPVVRFGDLEGDSSLREGPRIDGALHEVTRAENAHPPVTYE